MIQSFYRQLTHILLLYFVYIKNYEWLKVRVIEINSHVRVLTNIPVELLLTKYRILTFMQL